MSIWPFNDHHFPECMYRGIINGCIEFGSDNYQEARHYEFIHAEEIADAIRAGGTYAFEMISPEAAEREMEEHVSDLEARREEPVLLAEFIDPHEP
jgi:hypothetical protein